MSDLMGVGPGHSAPARAALQASMALPYVISSASKSQRWLSGPGRGMLIAARASMPIFLPSGRAARLQTSALNHSVDGLLQSADLQAAAQRFLSIHVNKRQACSQAVVSVLQCELACVSLDDQVGFLCSDQATTCTVVAAWCQQSRLCSLAHLDTSSATPSAINSLTEVCSWVQPWDPVQDWSLLVEAFTCRACIDQKYISLAHFLRPEAREKM